MRSFLLHPDDDFHGAWTDQHWDTVVDLGRAPRSFYAQQSDVLRCPVFSIFDLAVEVGDMQAWRPLFEPSLGRVVDRMGIDWWDVISVLLQPDLQEVRLATRLAEKLKGCTELVASRASLTSEILRRQLEVTLRLEPRGLYRRAVSGIVHRGRAAANLRAVHLLQVMYDKYDPHYRWRRVWAESAEGQGGSAPEGSNSDPVILLPSAYSNVTKTALSYAAMLPRHKFLLVLARESAGVSPVPGNVQTARLASFAPNQYDRGELRELENGWRELAKGPHTDRAIRWAEQIGVFQKGVRWLRWGLTVRDAWARVFESRSVSGCLSADDSNPYTRIPLLLARQRGLKAVACHHGALDCRMGFKNLRFSTYLAKGEMERDYLERICAVDSGRIRLAAALPPAEPFSAIPATPPANVSMWSDRAPWITFFTEPYETDFWRVEAMYRELLPRLSDVARRAGKTVLLKLHPFESVRHRRALVRRVLNGEDKRLVQVSDAALSTEILRKTWCALTVESTVAFECASAGIPVFLCGWLRHAYAGYAPQYVRFGAGTMLASADDLAQIPGWLPRAMPGPGAAARLTRTVSPLDLWEILGPPKADVLRYSETL
jgi:hypothetical protein